MLQVESETKKVNNLKCTYVWPAFYLEMSLADTLLPRGEASGGEGICGEGDREKRLSPGGGGKDSDGVDGVDGVVGADGGERVGGVSRARVISVFASN